MSLLFSLALRNALRNRRRSALTALTVTLGVALLLMGMAWVNGVLGGALHTAAHIAGEVRIVKPDYAQKEQLFPLYANIPESDPLVAAAARLPGVTGAYARIAVPMTLTVGDEIGEHFTLVQGAADAWFIDVMAIDQHIESGRMMQGDKEIVLGKLAAAEAGAKVGDTVYLLGQTQDGELSGAKLKLVGIADMGNGGQNKISYVTLNKVRDLANIPSGALEVLIYGADPDTAGALAREVGALPEATGLLVQAWDSRDPYRGMIQFAKTISGLAVGAIVFITALGVLNTMLMSVLERTGEIGVLRAMGLSRIETIGLFMLEALGISASGGVAGVALGSLLAWGWLQRIGINLGGAVKNFPSAIPVNTVVRGQLEPQHVVFAFSIALVMAVVGSALPALRAAGIQPVEAMRSRK